MEGDRGTGVRNASASAFATYLVVVDVAASEVDGTRVSFHTATMGGTVCKYVSVLQCHLSSRKHSTAI